MGAVDYLAKITQIIENIRNNESQHIEEAAGLMAEAIAGGGWVYVFGSGHSVIPAMDIFPRYGSFVGFRPLMDPRLIWFNVIGPGGAPELLWIERQEGYIANFLNAFDFREGEVMLVFSHGGLNAAPVEAALYAKERGLKVVAVTSRQNYLEAEATHSSGKKLGDLADVLIDNCVPLEDALVEIPGLKEKVGAGSTVAVTAIATALVAGTARALAKRGYKMKVFVSPNVSTVTPEHNQEVFKEYWRRTKR